jgi:glycosyltransferase involved in cell wall biosynthesis
MSSGKPVLTSRDSGGPTELVEDGVNGWVLDDEPGFARRLQALADDAAGAERLRGACLETASRHRWTDVAARLAETAV